MRALIKKDKENKAKKEGSACMKALLLTDIRRGIGRNILWFLPVVFLVTFSVWQRHTLWAADAAFYGNTEPPGLTDYVFFYFRGSDPVPEGSNRAPGIPLDWLCVHMYLVFLVGKYSMADLKTSGKNVLARCPKRASWWYERCLWSVLCALSYYALTLGVITVSFLFFHGPEALAGCQLPMTDTKFLAICYGAPLLVFITLALLQHVLSLVLRPVYGLLILTAALMVSVFRLSPFLIGNLSMLCRSRYYDGMGDITAGQTLLLCLALCCAAVVSGRILFKRKDIL